MDNFWIVYLALTTFPFLSSMGYPNIFMISYTLFICLFIFLLYCMWFLLLDPVLPILNNLRDIIKLMILTNVEIEAKTGSINETNQQSLEKH